MSFPRYPKYKDSGVQWLGEVPEHWETGRLKNNFRLLTEKVNGRRIHAVALENVESWTGRFVATDTEFEGDGIGFEPGDILFGKLRPYLAKVHLADREGEAVGDFHVMRPSSDIHERFARYQLSSREFIAIVDGSTFGSKMPRASWEFVGGMAVTVPPFAEQATVATFLDRETAKIDALVGEQRRLIELLKEKRQAVISHAVTKGLNPNVPLKPSGIDWLGDVPEHWEVYSLKRELAILTSGSRGWAENYSDVGELSLDDVKNLLLTVPPVMEQRAIVEFLDCKTEQFDSLVFEAERAIALLQERRTALISAAVTGKIDVRSLAAQAEAA